MPRRQSSSGGVNYDFEVATDTAFANKVFTNATVPAGASQTSVVVSTLAGPTTYYWHARAQANGTTGPFGGAFKFTIGAPVLYDAPIAAESD